jgi:hypothetical protein
MKKPGWFIALFAAALSYVQAGTPNALDLEKYPSRGSMFAAARIGLRSYAATDDPFETMPFPVGVSFEYLLSNRLGIGATLTYDKWSDYLGMFGGKYEFRVLQPSISLAYHFKIPGLAGLRFGAGADCGYIFLAIKNELGNTYTGPLKGQPEIAPFLAAEASFWPRSEGVVHRLRFFVQGGWLIARDFSGFRGAVGIGLWVRDIHGR